MYAKLINGTLRSAPKKVTYSNITVFNPPPDVLLALGYLPITYTNMPTDAPDGWHYESHWQQTDTAIVQAWGLVENPVYPENEPEATMQDLEAAIKEAINSDN